MIEYKWNLYKAGIYLSDIWSVQRYIYLQQPPCSIRLLFTSQSTKSLLYYFVLTFLPPKQKTKCLKTVFRINGERTSVRNLKAFNEPIPKPAKHEVLVKVHAVSLNFRDIAIATSQYPFPVKDSVVPCSDAAGEVVQVGEGVKKVAVGDRVVGTFDPTNLFGQQADWLNSQGGPVDGVLREYVTIPAVAAVKVPKDSPQSFSEWSTLVCTGVTAWNALYGNVPLKPGQIVLCQGNSSSSAPL